MYFTGLALNSVPNQTIYGLKLQGFLKVQQCLASLRNMLIKVQTVSKLSTGTIEYKNVIKGFQVSQNNASTFSVVKINKFKPYTFPDLLSPQNIIASFHHLKHFSGNVFSLNN